MIVKTIKQIEGSDRDVKFKEGRSLRLILASEKMGFSFHKTIIEKGKIGHWHYLNHLESCYCVSGKGVLTNLKTNEVFNIEPESIYLLNENDDHLFEAIEETVLISVFNPPVTGNEVHDENNSYVDSGIYKNKAKEIVEAINATTNNYDAISIVEKILKQK